MKPPTGRVLTAASLLVWSILTDRLDAVSVIMVNTAADTTNACATTGTGTCSLRDAITYANSQGGATINFSIGSGVQTIAPGSALPLITAPVTIDGTTQPGFAGSPIVEINGSSVSGDGLAISATNGGSTIRGLVINRFKAGGFPTGSGIGIYSTNNVVEGCFLGTNVAGTAAGPGNARAGVFISNTSGNRIGGPTAAQRNVISGNTGGVGVQIYTFVYGESQNNVIQGNYIGTDVTGSVGLGNGSGAAGVYVDGSNNIVGGTGPGEGNLISGNGFSTQGVGVVIPRPSATADVIDGNVVQGNLIGTDATGSFAIGNGYGVTTNGTNTLLGGITPGARNVISGNAVHGTVLAGTGDTVQGNFIGTDATGKVALGNAMRGVFVAGANALIGGTTAAARNIISANRDGIIVDYQSTGARIQGNFIGTDVTGKAALGNLGVGIGGPSTTGTGTVIGGTAPGAGNLISGNGQGGISQAVGITIQGNLIGTDITGAAPLANGGYGVVLASNLYGGATLGGSAPGAGNTIAFNSGAGVGVSPPSGSLDNGGNAILGNSIFSNGGLGIDLGGLVPNDPCDTDGGANQHQNFPVLSNAFLSDGGTTTTIQGVLNSAGNTTYRIEFFSNAVCDPSRYGEGQTYIGFTDVATDNTCSGTFNVTLPMAVAPRARLTATATDPNDNTSEFSSCISLAARFYTVTPCRVADTRRPNGPYGGPALDPTSDRSFVVAGQCGIPAGAQAVAFNFAIVKPTGGGHIRVYPGGVSLPVVAAMNYSAGQIRANNAIVPLGPAGDILVHLGQGAGTTADLVIDVNGYFE